MKLTLQEIAQICNARFEPGDDERPGEQIAREVVVDTRQLLGSSSLFVALKGPNFDGQDFVTRAFEKGAVAALVHHSYQARPADKALLRVDDTFKALQELAKAWRARFQIPLVGVTGSNGKTIVKDMLASIMSRETTVYRSPGSYNSQVGVPLAILGIEEEHKLAIIEAGISRPGEMERLEEILRPTHGIITNIGLAHAAGLKDLETTAAEKAKLFRRTTGPVVMLASEERLKKHLFHVKQITLGEENAPVAVQARRLEEGGFDVELSLFDAESLEFELGIPGRHNVDNAAMAAAMATTLGASNSSIIQGLSSYSLREMRLEMHTTGADITLINDAYNADPTSVRAALAVLSSYAGKQRRIAILGDMLDLGAQAEPAHREIGGLIAQMQLDHLFCVGELARFIGAGALEKGMAAEKIETIADFQGLDRRLDEVLRSGDVVLFKASRSVGLDRAARRLLESVAPTRLLIDLSAIRHNFHSLRKRIGEGVKVMAVVKSFGYGNDATRVSQTLIQEGVDALGVAFPDEAIPLRKKGINLPILVTNTRAAEADKIVKYDLDALVYTKDVAQELARQAAEYNKVIGLHLEVDTGMNRAGLPPDEVADFAAFVEQEPNLRIAGVMTHFAAADDAAEDEFTRQQLALFHKALADLQSRGIRPPLIHAANTAAAWRFPQARFDMVRIGLGLYGLHPSEDVATEARQVQGALQFTTRVLHIHDISAGESVGYGRTWKADSPRVLATIAAGYNDGLPRFLSNRGQVLINGHFCPLVGNICMDVAVVDITDAGLVQVGDEVVLFGTQEDRSVHIDEWAAMGHTISYELLCNISPRVRRIFRR